MPRKSIQPGKTSDRPPAFLSEANEADWWASPAGQRFTERLFRKSLKSGTLKVSQGVPDPAKMREVLERAREAMTKSVPLRLPIGDIEAAQRIAERSGIGYQTLLKQIIHDSLRRAS